MKEYQKFRIENQLGFSVSSSRICRPENWELRGVGEEFEYEFLGLERIPNLRGVGEELKCKFLELQRILNLRGVWRGI